MYEFVIAEQSVDRLFELVNANIFSSCWLAQWWSTWLSLGIVGLSPTLGVKTT